MSKFFRNNRKGILSGILIILVFFFLALPASRALADATSTESALSAAGNGVLGAVGGAVTIIVGAIALILVSAIGLGTTLLVWVLVTVAQYNNFIGAPTVVQGWVIVRDLCNMFFILILLLIAFSTILRLDDYNIKKTLPKLLIMAVLINFSKTIFGLLIDFSQVIMLTFVSSFKNGGGHFIEAFQVNNWLSISQNGSWGDKDANQWSTVLAIIMALIAAILTFILVAVLLAVLVMRIVMLWIYTLLSPLVFLGFAIPAIGKYTAQIWNDFIKQLIVGPALAFFLWLALATASGSSDYLYNGGNLSQTTGQPFCVGIGSLFCGDQFQKFVIVVGLLMGGLMVTQQMGGAIAKAANFGEKWSKKGLNLGRDLGGWGARKIKASTGYEVRPTKIWEGIKAGLAEKSRKEEAEGEAKSASALREGGVTGLLKGLGASKDMTEAMARGFLYRKGFKMAGETIKAGGVRKDIKKMQEEKKKMEDELETLKDKEGKVTNQVAYNNLENQIKEKDQKIKQKEKELSNLHVPYTFSADQGRTKMVREAMGKIGDNDNAEDLIAMWKHAKAVGDKEMAAAVFLAAVKNGHSNEIIMAEKGKEGKFKGKTYDTNQDGLNAFVKEQMMGELGMAEQEAFNYQSQFSSIAKSVGHWMFAESMGSKNGKLYQLSRKDQEKAARAEARKVDPEKFTRDRNRFGYGYETEVIDGAGEARREFRFSNMGLQTVTENAARIHKEIENNRFNANAAMKFMDDIGTLDNYINKLEAEGKSLDYILKINKDGTTENGNLKQLLAMMKDYGQQKKDMAKAEADDNFFSQARPQTKPGPQGATAAEGAGETASDRARAADQAPEGEANPGVNWTS